MGEAPDAPVVTLCQAGDEEGFRQLFQMYRAYVYSLCYGVSRDREEALDMSQEVFLTVLRGIRTVNPALPLKPWLRRVTVNVCLNYVSSPRGRFRAQAVPDDTIEELATSDAGPAGEFENQEVRAAIRKALKGLGPEQRLAVALFHQEGLSYGEIAEETGWPLGTVKTNLFRGRKELAKRVASILGGDEER